MATFQFIARSSDGRIERGRESAESAGAAVAAIRGRGSMVIDVRLDEAASDAVEQLLPKLHPNQWLPVRSIDVEISLSQLAVMLRGGLTLLAALANVAEQSQRASLARVWNSVSRKVQSGSSLASALEFHRCFPVMAVQLVRIGEQTGNLEPVLRRAAELMERRRSLRNTLLTALAYPSLVLVAAIGVTIFMVVSVIPKLEVFLSQLGKKLPPMTQSLLDASAFVRMHGIECAVVSALLIGVAIAIYASAAGRLIVDRLLLRLPLIGNLLRLAATALVARSLSMLLQSGVTLLEALRTIEKLPNNRYLQKRLTMARENVIQGGTLADGLRESGAFLGMLSAMTAVGESSGTLDEVLEDTARFHEEQLQVAIRRFSAIIEPAIVVVVGSIVGYVYIAFFVAMFAAAG